jgi:hypothetical protein
VTAVNEQSAGALDKVIAFIATQSAAYCADCIRARLSLGRDMTSTRLFKAAAASGTPLLQEPGKCMCCRRARKLLRIAQ